MAVRARLKRGRVHADYLWPLPCRYYIAPCSAGFLLVPFALLEAKPLFNDPNVHIDAFTFLSNAAAAFG